MDDRDERRVHDDIGLVGLRAQATAVGLLQLCSELARAGLLDDGALARIKSAIAKDLALSRPHSMSAVDFESWVHARLDGLFLHLLTTGEAPHHAVRNPGNL
jgi:hypothetical protein